MEELFNLAVLSEFLEIYLLLARGESLNMDF